MKLCKYNLVALLSCVLLLMTAAILPGCGSSGLSRAAIEGKVLIGDQPLKAGRITFIPVAPNEGPAVSTLIVDGRYRIDRSEGPVVGANRVEVEADRDLGFALDDEQAFIQFAATNRLPPNPVPPEFNSNSRLQKDVEEGQENRFDVTIPAPTLYQSSY